jgi:hypothetical protein
MTLDRKTEHLGESKRTLPSNLPYEPPKQTPRARSAVSSCFHVHPLGTTTAVTVGEEMSSETCETPGKTKKTNACEKETLC